MNYNTFQADRSTDEPDMVRFRHYIIHLRSGSPIRRASSTTTPRRSWSRLHNGKMDAMNASEELAFNLDAEDIHVPEIQVQAPSRTNTNLAGLDGAVAEYQPRSPLYVEVAPTRINSPVSIYTPNITMSSGASSTTSLIDSAFSSLDICEVCRHAYKNKSDKKKHVSNHIKPYKCLYPECTRSDKGFATANDLDRHSTSVHKIGLKKRYRCAYPDCQKTNTDHCFDRKDNFTAHIRRRHRGLRMASEIDALIVRSEEVLTEADLDRQTVQAKVDRAPHTSASFIRKTSHGRKRANASSVSRGISPSADTSATVCGISSSAPATFNPTAPPASVQDMNTRFASGLQQLSEGQDIDCSTRGRPMAYPLDYGASGSHEPVSRGDNQSANLDPCTFQKRYMPRPPSHSGLTAGMKDQSRTFSDGHARERLHSPMSFHPVCPFGYGLVMQGHRQGRFAYNANQSYNPHVSADISRGAATGDLSFNQTQGQNFLGQSLDDDRRFFHDSFLDVDEG